MRTLRADRLQPKGFNQYLGSRIVESRRSLSLSQRDLAGRSFLRADLLCKYETGTHPPTVRTLHRIAEAVGKPVDVLLPELSFTEGADQVLYRLFREVWFLPLETRRVLATLLTSILTFPATPSARALATGGRDASRR